MGKRIIYVIAVLLGPYIWSQSILVNPFGEPASNYPFEALIESVFLKGDNCAPPFSNFQYYDNPQKPFPNMDRSWGYFKNNPQATSYEGVLITTGRVKNAEGPTKSYPNNSYGESIWLGNEITSQIIQTNTLNATSFEFDFVPTGTSFYFNYKFASSEYPGTMKNDVLAVILSGPGITNDPGLDGINLAKINNNPVTINNLVNTNMFVQGPFTDIGYSANSKDFYVNYHFLVPYQTYHVKFIIADAENSLIDSAAFLRANSLIYDFELVNTSQNIIGSSVTVCDEEEYVMMVNSDENDSAITYQWYYKKESGDEFEPIDGAVNRVYTVNRGELIDGFYSGDGYYGVEINNVQLCDEERFYYTKITFGDTPEILEHPSVYSACSETGTYFFNLNQLSADFSDNPDVLFTFQESLGGVTSEIEEPEFFAVTGTTYVRVRAAFINNVCSASFWIELHVGKPLVSLPYPEEIMCNPFGDVAIFNLKNYEDEFTPPEIDYTGTLVEYYTDPEYENLIEDPTQFQNTSNPQTLYVKIFYPEIPLCFAESEITLIVQQMPGTQDDEINVCDILHDEVEIVDLTENEILLNQNINVNIFYYDEEGEIITNPENYTITQDITVIKVFVENLEEGCSALRDLTINMDKVPVTEFLDITKCGFGGKAKFHLPDLNEMIVEGDLENLVFSYYLNEDEAVDGVNSLPDNFTTPQSEIEIFVRVENAFGCFEVNSVMLRAEDNMGVLDDIYTECETPWEPTSGHARFDLTSRTNSINSKLDLSETTISFHTSLAEANAGINAIHNSQNYLNITNPQTIYARAQNLSDDCGGVAEFIIEALPVPDLDIDENYVICVGNDGFYTIEGEYETYTWYDMNGDIVSTENQIIFTQGGIYTLEVTQTGMECPAKRNLEVLIGTPVILGIEVDGGNALFNATGGISPYQYSYDNGLTWISWNSVNDLPPGIYDLIVKGDTGCISNPMQFAILNIPNVITPNGDGINDTWEIRGLEIYSGANIKIFDRYGKIFVDKNINDGFVWNGEYMGRNVPTGDYWYILSVNGQKPIYGHISVKSQ